MGRNNRKLGTDSGRAAELIRSDAPMRGGQGRGGEAVFCCIRQGIGERQRGRKKRLGVQLIIWGLHFIAFLTPYSNCQQYEYI